ncbi:YggS family pyridoxal phosphate-dependent enzyme [Xylella taiwanensis]|nr:YggS family pyridoxal phosphate-dependent enzyme [Xylella taiwanensis]QKD99533.1 YggS family pyridoxal phosphate-dependent enzyme [Xylella taiwanensis]
MRGSQRLTVDDIRHNLNKVYGRIVSACQRVGRDPSSVRLLPVSKSADEIHIRLSYEAGCRKLAENHVQNAYRKWEAMADLTDLHWSVIGHLQTNKAKLVARFASEFQALDSLRVAETLERRLQIEGRGLDVFVQVNTSGEANKYGLPPEEVIRFVHALSAYPALRVRGLMTLALLSCETSRVRQCFTQLRTLQDRIQQALSHGHQVTELSMGMSGDFETAIEEGATVVRVGQAIYSAPTPPDLHLRHVGVDQPIFQ